MASLQDLTFAEKWRLPQRMTAVTRSRAICICGIIIRLAPPLAEAVFAFDKDETIAPAGRRGFGMGLRLHNTLTRTKEDFVPIDPANVRMYVCGPTVYDFAHIGNARPLIVFDVLFRLLRHLYGPEHVTYVRNITDVDDKINARAAEEYPDLPLNDAIREVTTRTDGAVPRGRRGARLPAADLRAARDRVSSAAAIAGGHDPPDRQADRAAATPTPPRATSSSTSRRCRTTAASPTAASTR